MGSTSRGGFFGAISQLFKEENTAIRPPYAVADTTFEECKSCTALCVNVCEEKIIRTDSMGVPFLDFSANGCSDCHKCLEACIPNVLNDPQRFIGAKARISTLSCMSHHNTICFSCKEPCMDNAIVFEGMFRPIIIPDKCTGCGYCISVCPSSAITISA
ncbi:MAG: 4Fe-4S binding protein [Epsilonproteobacteria bacterium]|nr:4Fe-4S binding protein [Campylobacterota bacterium]